MSRFPQLQVYAIGLGTSVENGPARTHPKHVFVRKACLLGPTAVRKGVLLRSSRLLAIRRPVPAFRSLDLTGPNFGTPARVDVLLGADYYRKVLLRGRW